MCATGSLNSNTKTEHNVLFFYQKSSYKFFKYSNQSFTGTKGCKFLKDVSIFLIYLVCIGQNLLFIFL